MSCRARRRQCGTPRKQLRSLLFVDPRIPTHQHRSPPRQAKSSHTTPSHRKEKGMAPEASRSRHNAQLFSQLFCLFSINQPTDRSTSVTSLPQATLQSTDRGFSIDHPSRVQALLRPRLTDPLPKRRVRSIHGLSIGMLTLGWGGFSIDRIGLLL